MASMLFPSPRMAVRPALSKLKLCTTLLETHADYHRIVAVHGLGADPDYTWTSQSPSISTTSEERTRVHLLRDLLKYDFPEARILAFAHNSDWLIDAPVTTAQLIGERLLDGLVKRRRKQRVGTGRHGGHDLAGANKGGSASRSSSSATALAAS